jgi:diguanylate cyclase (GGDEF)-like protein/PAS domain S-box-containing protein
MEINTFVYLISLGCLVVLTFGLALRILIKWYKPGARTLGFLMLSMALWAGFYLLEIAHPSLPVKIFARKMLYLGMSMSAPLWLGFALRYTGISTWWSSHGRTFFLVLPGLFASALGMTNEYHFLIWDSIRQPRNHLHPLLLEYGPGFWVFTVIAYILIGTGIAIYVLALYRNSKGMRVKMGVVLAGALITTLANSVFLLSASRPLLDPTPISFVLSAPLLAFGYFRFGVPSLLPHAANIILDSLRDAILIVDENDHITDINQTAITLLGVSPSAKNSPIFDVLPYAARLQELWNKPNRELVLEFRAHGKTYWFEVRVMPLHKNGTALLGKIITFHDVTNEQSLLRAEKRRSQQLALLEESGRVVADSFNEVEILQRAVDIIIQRFGYPEAAISKVTEENMLEATAIAGTADFGYRPGYLQKMGEGIIGYTALSEKTYVTNDVASDPYYFSSDTRDGSAICTPIWRQGKVFGVLYVESLEQNTFDELDITTLETLASQISSSLQRASLYAETQENLRVLSAIQNISRAIAGSLDIKTISHRVVQHLADAFGYTHISIYILKDDHLHLSAQVGYPDETVIEKIHINQGVSGRAIRTRAVQFIEDTSKEMVFLKADNHITSEICVPLIKEDTVIGTLNVETNQKRALNHPDVDLLVTVAGIVAVSMDNARLHAEVKELATTDAVTRLANRHVFEQSLTAEIERARRQGEHLSLIIFDIDSFKEYNDTWGHPAGDRRLKAVADMIKNKLRKYDVAARYGGDEFAIILSNSDSENALAFAQRLQHAAREGAPQPLAPTGGAPGYTLSMGIATFPQDASAQNELLHAADHAAMKSKQMGKNQIQLANSHAPNEPS